MVNFLEILWVVVIFEVFNVIILVEEEVGKEIDSYVVKGIIEIIGVFSRLFIVSIVNMCIILGFGFVIFMVLRNLKVEF